MLEEIMGNPIPAARQVVEDALVRLDAETSDWRMPRPDARMQVLAQMHFHSRPELFLQVSGISRMQFPKEVIRVRPGQLLLVPRGAPHQEKGLGREGEFLNLVFGFDDGTFGFHFSVAHNESPCPIRGLRMKELSAARMVRCLEEATRWGQSAVRWRQLFARAQLISALGEIRTVLEDAVEEPSLESYKVGVCRQYVMSHFMDPDLTVRRMAEVVQCSPDYLSSLFHRETGMTLVRYMQEQRLAYARDLLRSSSLNVAEIARACGIPDAGYFSRLFRKHSGQTPMQYRKATLPGRRAN